MNIVDEILKRAELCYGVCPLPWDRLHKGNKQKAAFFMKLIRERVEMQDSLDIAAVSMANMHDEIQELHRIIKASGDLSVGLGAKRKDSK